LQCGWRAACGTWIPEPCSLCGSDGSFRPRRDWKCVAAAKMAVEAREIKPCEKLRAVHACQSVPVPDNAEHDRVLLRDLRFDFGVFFGSAPCHSRRALARRRLVR